MSTRTFQLKQKILEMVPDGELPWVLFTRIALKSGINFKNVEENTNETDDKLNRAINACKEIFGSGFNF